MTGFNPWRVFWLVATSWPMPLWQSHHSFNPWRVFWLVATWLGNLYFSSLPKSFNPWRVFWLVATWEQPRATHPLAQFQSLAGFLARCDINI